MYYQLDNESQHSIELFQIMDDALSDSSESEADFFFFFFF